MIYTQKELSAIKTAARNSGLKRYFGNLCAKHPELRGERDIWNGGCCRCSQATLNARASKSRSKNKDRINQLARDKRAANPEPEREAERRIYHQTKARRAEIHKKYRDKPEVKARILANGAQWRAQNLHKKRAYQAKRRLKQAAAIALHFKVEIDEVYRHAVALTTKTGMPHEVDHIMPLNHPAFCGLHVPWNMQVITESENARKHNKLPEEAMYIAPPNYSAITRAADKLTIAA